jgi:hypothetical protein
VHTDSPVIGRLAAGCPCDCAGAVDGLVRGPPYCFAMNFPMLSLTLSVMVSAQQKRTHTQRASHNTHAAASTTLRCLQHER